MFGLHEIEKDKLIFFQEITPQDIEIAEKFGYRYIGHDTNVGIATAYKALVESAYNDLFLFLENDWTLIEEPHDHLYAAADMLRNHAADVVRLRHRRYPGDPLYTRQFQGKELEHPTHLLDSIHWTDPLKFEQIVDFDASEEYVATSSKYANWTNNPTMFRTKWLKEHIIPRIGNRDVEVDIQSWWEQQNFVVVQGKGLFTHNRIG